jgi:hypothetical protein
MTQIDLIEHKNLLKRCRRLPFVTDPGGIFNATLKGLYKKYKAQTEELKETMKQYEGIALLVSEKQPLVPERKYITIKKTEPV